MPEGAKSFWQSIPGMVTATAGFLSAATGLMLGLNQTGVIDLKQIAGKPAAQTTAAVPAGTNPSKPGEASEPISNAQKAQSNVDATTTAARDESAVTAIGPSGAPKNSPQPSLEPKTRTADGNMPVRPAPSTASGESAKPVSPTETKPGDSAKPGFQPPPPSSVSKASVPAGPSRSADGTKQAPSPSSSTPPVVIPKPAPPSPTKSAEMKTQEPLVVPPPPPVQDKSSPARPDIRDRVASARNPRTGSPDDDARKPRVLRPDEASTAPKDKDVVDPKQGSFRGVNNDSNGQLDLTGLKLTVPPGWMKQEIQPSPMGPVAEFKIPNPDGRGADGAVRVTHFLGAKGKEMEDRTIERWLSQVTKPDGTPLIRANARIETSQHGPIRITTVDLAGTLKATPHDTPQPGQRMIAAIIDHPRGAHMVVVDGPAPLMAKWAPSVDAFFKSAKPD